MGPLHCTASSPSVAARPLPPFSASRRRCAARGSGRAALCSSLRAPGVPAWRLLSAEDATVFLSRRSTARSPRRSGRPTRATCTRPAADRLARRAAAALRRRRGVAINSAVVVSLLAAYVWWRRARCSRRGSRARLLVVLFLFAPQTLIEIGGTAANYHWYGMLASFFAFLHRPATGARPPRRPRVVGFTALSDPMLALLLPLLVLRPGGLLRAQLGARAIPAAALARLAAQALAVLTSSGPESVSAFSPLDLPTIYAQRVAGPAVLGDSGSGSCGSPPAGPRRGWRWRSWPGSRCTRRGAAARRSAARAARRRRRRWCCSRCRWRSAARPRWRPTWATCSTAAPATRTRRWSSPGCRRCCSSTAAASGPRASPRSSVVIVVASTTGTTDRSLGPDWADSLAQARQTCVAGSVVDIRVAPLSYPVGGRPLLRSHPRVSAFIRSGHSRAPAAREGLPMTNQTSHPRHAAGGRRDRGRRGHAGLRIR